MAAGSRFFSKADLYGMDFPWTVVNGRIFAIGPFLSQHPGGALIRRAIGEDATQLFHAHHPDIRRPLAVLSRYEVGHLRSASAEAFGPMPASCVDNDEGNARPFQRALNERVGGLGQRPARPVAEVIAAVMLMLFFVWAYLAYVAGWQVLNVLAAWFWWRHLDAGLHSVAHGDFRHSRSSHRMFLRVYSVLSRHMLEYYAGDGSLNGCGMPRHWWHHIYTNDPRRDPDWSTMTGDAWVRRHPAMAWQPFHAKQHRYWLLVTFTLDNITELLNMTRSVVESGASLLAPPTPAAGPFCRRFRDAMSLAVEVSINPGYQGAAFVFQPFRQALVTLLCARAVAKLLLYPFSEVQHYMPEHLDTAEGVRASDTNGTAEDMEWAVKQMHTTANLALGTPLARAMDFLMFHGDSHQIEHHLWPAMSFVHLRHAAVIVKEVCAEYGVPYHEIGYWEGYVKILRQVRRYSQASPASPKAGCHCPCDAADGKRSPSDEEERCSDGSTTLVSHALANDSVNDSDVATRELSTSDDDEHSSESCRRKRGHEGFVGGESRRRRLTR